MRSEGEWSALTSERGLNRSTHLGNVVKSVGLVPSIGAVLYKSQRFSLPSAEPLRRSEPNSQDIEGDLSSDRVGEAVVGELLLEGVNHGRTDVVDLRGGNGQIENAEVAPGEHSSNVPCRKPQSRDAPERWNS